MADKRLVTVMRLMGTARGVKTPHDNRYLVAYEPSMGFFDGTMVLETSPRIADAMTFANRADALALWKAPIVDAPLRPDGKPERPLTAWNVEFFEIEVNGEASEQGESSRDGGRS